MASPGKRSRRTPKPIGVKIRELDHHIFLLRSALHRLRDDPAHLKAIAVELRVLSCLSSGTEGLLWRVADELSISDEMDLQLWSGISRDHPINRGLEFATISLYRAGEGPPWVPTSRVRLREVLKESEAVFLPSVSGEPITHQQLIKAVAEQIGSAHEDDGIDWNIERLQWIHLGGVHSYFHVLARDAELVLEVEERVLEEAVLKRGYKRAPRHELGDVTIVLRLHRRAEIAGRIELATFRAPISAVEISIDAYPATIRFTVTKWGRQLIQLSCPGPSLLESGCDETIALSFSSNHQLARTIVSGIPQPQLPCAIGFVDAREFVQPVFKKQHAELIELQDAFLYSRLIESAECKQLRDLSRAELAREMTALRCSVSADVGPFPD